MTLAFLNWELGMELAALCWAVSPALLVQSLGLGQTGWLIFICCLVICAPAAGSVSWLGVCPWLGGTLAARVVSCLPAQPVTGHSHLQTQLYSRLYFF